MPKITIYTTKNCPYSKRLKEFLYDEEIPFEEIRADKDKQSAGKLQAINKELRTPTIEFQNGDKKEIIVGLNELVKSKILTFYLKN